MNKRLRPRRFDHVDWELEQAVWNRVFARGYVPEVLDKIRWLSLCCETDADVIAHDTTLLDDLAALYDWTYDNHDFIFEHVGYVNVVLRLVNAADPSTAHTTVSALFDKGRQHNSERFLVNLMAVVIRSEMYRGLCREAIWRVMQRARVADMNGGFIDKLFMLFNDKHHGGWYFLRGFIQSSPIQELLMRRLTFYAPSLRQVFVRNPDVSVVKVSEGGWRIVYWPKYVSAIKIASPRASVELFFDYIFLRRFTEVAIALHPRQLGALQTLAIADALLPNRIPMHLKWKAICATKHFHTRR